METLNKSNFPERLKSLRWKMRLTQDAMGKRLDVSGNYVWMLEKGDKDPSQKVVDRVTELETQLEAGSNPRLSEDTVPYKTAGMDAEARRYFEDFLHRCEDKPDRLGWLLVQLREHFPLDKWEARVHVPGTPGTPNSKRVASAASGSMASAAEIAGVAPKPSRRPGADEPNVHTHKPASGAGEE